MHSLLGQHKADMHTQTAGFMTSTLADTSYSKKAGAAGTPSDSVLGACKQQIAAMQVESAPCP